MAFIPDPNNIDIDFGAYIIHVPKSVSNLIQSVPTEIRELDLNQFRLKLKDIEDGIFGMAELRTHKHNTTVSVGGVDLARVIEIINGYTVTFEDGQYAIQLVGANSNVGDVVNVNQVSIRTANSVGLVTSKAIEFGEYGNKVTVKPSSPYSGTVYPTGTGRQPVNNIPDAVALCVQYGFPEIYAVEDLELKTGDNVQDLLISGVSHVNTHINVLEGANCLRTAFRNFDLSGVLDGDSEILNCIIRDIDYFNGHIHDSYLTGRITLQGSKPANIENCSILDITNPPIIDAGGFGQNLIMSNYSGLIIIENLTGNTKLGIGLDAGQVDITSSCTAGVIACAGSGTVYDNSGLGCYVVDTVTDGTEISNLQSLVENLRPHHTGIGNIWFWDPFNGNDLWDAEHPKRAMKTFQTLHDNKVVDNNHDIIICVSGNPAGLTLTTQEMTIWKNFVFVRGPGRDFQKNQVIDTSPAINITGNGVEVSGMIVTTELTNTTSTIRSQGDFTLLKNLYLEKSVNGVHFVDTDEGLIDSCTINHNTGYGVLIEGNSNHSEVNYSHIGSNGTSGIIIDLTTGHEVNTCTNIIHNNTEYGINVIQGDDVTVTDTSSIYNNGLADLNGAIVDLRTTNSSSISPQDIADITDSVLGTDIAPYHNTNGIGGALAHIKYMEYMVFIDTVDGLPTGTGTFEDPFDNENDGIDYAELHGIKNLIIYNEITLQKQIKNFVVRGIGVPKVNMNGQDLKNTEFTHCELVGDYLDRIIAQDCYLTGTTTLNGIFDNCALSSDFLIPDGGTAYVNNTKPFVVGFVKPSFNIGGLTGTASLNIMGYEGGLSVINCNQPTDDVKIVVHGGVVELDASCTDGNIRLFGEGILINNSSLTLGVNLINNMVDPNMIVDTNTVVNIIDGNVDLTLTNLALLDGKVDIVDSNVDLLLINIALLDGKVDVIGANIDTVLANQAIINAEIALIPLEVWNFDSNHNFIDNSMGAELSHIKYINHFVFVDADVAVNGDGSQHNPFDNITDAIDLAEANNTKQIILFSDINVDRQLKNFTIIGIGSPKVDFLTLPDLTGTTFKDCILSGQHIGNITAKNCRLETALSLNGRYIDCGLNGDLVCTGTVVVFVNGASVIAGLGRPTVSMNPTGYCSLSMRSQRGGLTIQDCNNALDVVTVGISEGSLTFDSSCTDGEMVARGSCVFVDEATLAGAHVTDETFSPFDTRNIALQVWNFSKDYIFDVDSMGEWLVKKVLTIKAYLGLK